MKTKPFLAVLLLSCVATPVPRVEPIAWTYRSPIDLVVNEAGTRLYVAESTAQRISVFDTDDEKTSGTIPLPAAPSGLTLSADGEKLFVTGGVAEGRLWVVDFETGLESELAVGHSPLAPVASRDGTTLWLANRFENTLSRIDLASMRVTERIPTVREPIACALTPDDATLLVASHLPAGPADADFTAARVALLDTATGETRAHVELPNGSTGLRDLCISPCGRYAFVPHILARFHHPTTQLERGWVNTNTLSLIDIAGARLVATVILDHPELGAANPWGVAVVPAEKKLVVTHAGSHCASVIDLPALLERLESLSPEELVLVPDQLNFLAGIRERVELVGTGPRGVVASGPRVFAAEYFTDSIASIDIAADRPHARSLTLGPLAPPTETRRGELLFHDATICFQQWQSCTSCHPDGRADGLNWDLLNDGLGNPKNTKSLLLAHTTPPAMVTGIRADGEAGVRAGIRHILFAVRPETDAQAIDTYLTSLAPVPSPHLVAGDLSPAARSGRGWYESAGCAHCHPSPLFTDLEPHDLAHTRGLDAGRPLDTPTLVETWRTAPYLHDGRAVDLRTMLIEHDRDQRHGGASQLEATQLDELLAYVLSL